MRYHDITTDDMKNGDGLRVVLWVSGCEHHCDGCQNPITWDPNDGLIFGEEAFEEICFNHIKQIKSALGISGVSSTESTFLVKGASDAEGMQLDLVIDRRDDVINLCEIKFYKEPFYISKEYSVKLQSRSSYLERLFPKKSVHLTLISTYGASDNMYSSVLQSEVTMDDLFASD